MIKIVLASSSPRRRQLLTQIGLEFEVIKPDIDETNSMNLEADELVKFLAYEKAHFVAKDISKSLPKDERCLVIGSDTVVVKDKILGKPKNNQEAFEMLKHIQGSWHKVMTGVAVIDAFDMKGISDFEITDVKIKELSDNSIKAYVDSKEPLDKAGAYGIQGLGSVLVEKINGCYFNVVGLPLAKLETLLNKFKVDII
ncbi:Maf family protein [Herbivorax sp. ANBcel31]|uniref:Maf family protein n=1 Tax=Herbivorax sp. ANBcel31 TaxID=3069754 RepID=UPI0027B7BD82|nr:Maf family protein [Herbivorax sp. ANBcel31]MDQ2086278.1 Maf family protein [Herbivorax sp. ANBcel31]